MFNYCRFELALKRVSEIFHGAFILLSEELILDRKHNIYFRLDNIESELQFKCKMLEYLSRPAHKGIPVKDQNYILEKLNKFFDKSWTKSDMEIIYTNLGNGVNRQKCMNFIVSDFDFEVLKGK